MTNDKEFRVTQSRPDGFEETKTYVCEGNEKYLIRVDTTYPNGIREIEHYNPAYTQNIQYCNCNP